MTEQITPAQFHDAAGVEDWRFLVFFNGVCAHFRTGSFANGVALAGEVGRLADAAHHHAEIDLRNSSVTVRLKTHHVGSGLSARDVQVARQISTAARELDASADPTAVQELNVTIDALVGSDVIPFWRTVLGYQDEGVEEELMDPWRHGPSFWFQDMDAARLQRNRIHVEIAVPHDQAEARVAAAIAAGGTLVSDERAPMWWVLADAEGNEVHVATWVGSD